MATHCKYSCLKNLMDTGALWATTVHGVTKSQTRLSTYTRCITIIVYPYITPENFV